MEVDVEIYVKEGRQWILQRTVVTKDYAIPFETAQKVADELKKPVYMHFRSNIIKVEPQGREEA
ncbi:MAG: hypothetical protein WBP80_08670 [Planifilum fulgidum]|jgi:hypothetical protein